MCLIGAAIQQSMSRRTFIKGAGSVATIPLLTAFGGSARATPSPAAVLQDSAGSYNTRIVLLGTAGGPVWWPDSNRVSASSALVVGDAFYLIDLGHGASYRLAQAFNSGVYVDTPDGRMEQGNPAFLRQARALFFTHLHMDHTADYASLLLIGQAVGLNSQQPLQVYGPGNRGMLEPVFGGPEPPIVNPENPTPGTVEMTNYLFQAYAQSINDFMRDMRLPDFRTVVNLHDIPLPAMAGFVDPNQTPAPRMDPFTIYQDDRVRVQATLVNHASVFPSFAFRFDTNDGSVVFSGDTGPNENLIRMAQGADVLVHEVIDPAYIHLMFPEPSDMAQAVIHHLETSHTPIPQVGGVAEAAGVKTLVLNHIVPGNAPIAHLQQAGQGFSGSLVIGQDLMQIGVGRLS
jgi:ribonuclease BN (tRNA processing enzyme)